MVLFAATHDMDSESEEALVIEAPHLKRLIGDGIVKMATEDLMGKIEFCVEDRGVVRKFRISVMDIVKSGREYNLKLVSLAN